MPPKNENTEPTRAPYQGLLQQFRQACVNLCQHSLSAETWNSWHELKFKNNEGEQLQFPAEGKPEEKLIFVDHFLFSLLESHNMAPPNRNMYPHWRADLNKYRGWLLHRLLQQLNPSKKTQAPRRVRHAYTLPEDLPKIVDDLYLFHKHIKGKDANIFLCPNLELLSRLVAPHRPLYPLTHTDRMEAHASFMQTETPEELEAMLPADWKATNEHVITDKGIKIVRRGGAQLSASVSDGTEIIQLLTEDASRAYGSPRWCTAYRDRGTYFNTYKDNLLVILSPEGRRWQVHFRTRQFNDAADMHVEIEDFLQKQPLLAPVLRDCYLAILNDAQNNDLFETAAGLIRFAEYVPAWQPFIPPELPDKALRDAIEEDKREVATDILMAVTYVPAWQPAITANLREYLLFLLDGEDHLHPDDRERALSAIAKLPEWNTLSISYMPEIFENACKKGRKGAAVIESIFYMITERELEEWVLGLTPAVINALSSNKLHANIGSTIFAQMEWPERMALPWRQAIAPHLDQLILNLVNRDQVELFTTICEQAEEIPEWRQVIEKYIPPIARFEPTNDMLDMDDIWGSEGFMNTVITYVKERLNWQKGDISKILLDDQGVEFTLELANEIPQWKNDVTKYLGEVFITAAGSAHDIIIDDVFMWAQKIPEWRHSITNNLTAAYNAAVQNHHENIIELITSSAARLPEWTKKIPARPSRKKEFLTHSTDLSK